jgi:hypothetical protein
MSKIGSPVQVFRRAVADRARIVAEERIERKASRIAVRDMAYSRPSKSQVLRNRTFVDDLKERLANRVQVTSDGHGAYLRAPNALTRDVAIPSISAHLTLSARTSRCGCLWTGGTVY